VGVVAPGVIPVGVGAGKPLTYPPEFGLGSV